MIGCGLLSVSLLMLVSLCVVGLEASDWVITVMMGEGRTEGLVVDESA